MYEPQADGSMELVAVEYIVFEQDWSKQHTPISVDRIPSRPAPALSFGSSIHEALELFYDRKLPVEPTEDELVGFLYDTWDSSGFADVPRDEQKRWYQQGQDVLPREG